ncbi:hypothetical protein BC826DRAFT_317222 [Russula brevipes]|nr:hypothetical protein BC826DRAFT_317222 [Russula brevipes]
MMRTSDLVAVRLSADKKKITGYPVYKGHNGLRWPAKYSGGGGLSSRTKEAGGQLNPAARPWKETVSASGSQLRPPIVRERATPRPRDNPNSDEFFIPAPARARKNFQSNPATDCDNVSVARAIPSVPLGFSSVHSLLPSGVCPPSPQFSAPRARMDTTSP